MISAGPISSGRSPRRLRRPRRVADRQARAIQPRYVGRGTIYANPFRAERFGHARSVGLHRTWLAGKLGWRTMRRLGFNEHEIHALHRHRLRVLEQIHELAGQDLECWCSENSRWCHADTLMGIAAERAKPFAGLTPGEVAALRSEVPF